MVSAYDDIDNVRTAMNRGAVDSTCKPVNFNDLKLTIEKILAHVLGVTNTLNAIKENNILKMYVDETVLNFMNREEFETSLTSIEAIDATVIFVDICSFTSITEKEPADIIVKLLNRYFDVMVEDILGHGGYVDKFMGDAVMVVFKGEPHLKRAIEASLAVRNEIDSLTVSDELKFLPKVSNGVDSGEVISGNIGSAKLRRLDYTVIGDVVNTPQRLQSSAKEGEIVINENSFYKINGSFNCRMIGEIKLKNKLKAGILYEVLN